jgi:ATP-dependent Lhr-like helicase
VSAFDQLDPLVQHHVVNSLGWRSLRPLQEASIEPVLSGCHCLLLAPTAGGKTEAAMFPLFSRMIAERWPPLSLIYVCPLKALLNNLHQRLEAYSVLFGRRCEVWHGDVTASSKSSIKNEPPDILLTTPESLEAMLVSTKPEARRMLTSARAIVVDEIHAFAGDDRGWHLLSVLERVVKLAGRELQRIGLSATVGNPDALLEWFAGHCDGDRQVVAPLAGAASSPELTIDFVGSLANAALVISRLHRGEKRLVFCDSRNRVEQLVVMLRELSVEAYVSHSSLSAGQRREAEKAFAESRNCVIVSTSTLELGIDVGDLDRVIQIDAPRTVASFLQRIGRTGRRAGSSRNCLFLATNQRGLLRAAALLQLWETGWVEPVEAPVRPLHIWAQQFLALILQLGGMGRGVWREWIGRLKPFAEMTSADEQRLLSHLLSTGIVFEDNGRLMVGAEGEKQFGRRHFMELLSVFSSPPLFTVWHGQRELGQIELIVLTEHNEGRPLVLFLGGRSWVVTNIEWNRRNVWVEEAREPGKGGWLGDGLPLSAKMTMAQKKVLMADNEPDYLSQRAKTALRELRADWQFLREDAHIMSVDADRSRTKWITFGGYAANLAVAEAVHGSSNSGETEVTFEEAPAAETLLERLSQLHAEAVLNAATVPQDLIDGLKFSECLPLDDAFQTIHQRMFRLAEIEDVLRLPTVLVVEG